MKKHKPEHRIERDSLGEIAVPAEALYGAQTQRAIDNFPISGLTMPRAFIRSLGLVKCACAAVNGELGLLDAELAEAIQSAAFEVAEGKHDAHFPIDVFQTGSGTSTNMNANEVIARLATTRLGKPVHPNNHVNMSQSSNDVIPTCIHISSTLEISEELLPALEHLVSIIQSKGRSLAGVVKTGRTHLMDAMPLTMEQELSGWAVQMRQGIDRIGDSLRRLRQLPIGGTAVGTGINAPPDFGRKVSAGLAIMTAVEFSVKSNYFEGLSSQDSAVEMSGQLRTLAAGLLKICNDLRWMNSGPLAGLAEIELPVLQPGSSIMPGKVNPVIPEAVAMVCAQIMGNDLTISIAGQSGNFQLNVMLPLIAFNLLQSIELAAHASRLLADKAIRDFKVNHEYIEYRLSRNPILVTALNRRIGYEKGAEIVKRAYAEGRPILEVAAELTGLPKEQLQELLNPLNLTRGGLES
jgi:fumarate hydratase class II